MTSCLIAGRTFPDLLLSQSSRVANPAQSLHALTVGSVGHAVFDDGYWRSCAIDIEGASAFSRTGYAPPWSVVKPEVVEFGGDYVRRSDNTALLRSDPRTSIELLSSTLFHQPAHGCDGAGTSFAAPKVANLAAQLQRLFPDASPNLYRALIVQSARWPEWALAEHDKDRVLALIGYGRPDRERATYNSETRVTLITPEEREIAGKQYHLYAVTIPEELRGPAQEARIRVDVTLAYTSEPRRTRSRYRTYLETWLDWESSRQGEPLDEFHSRMETGAGTARENLPWLLDMRNDRGVVDGTNRTRGSVQKDWAIFPAHEFPPDFAIAVRGHLGWNHREGEGRARYSLVVSFEVVSGDVEIYEAIRSEIRLEGEIRNE
jgi:hypothetical protein